MESAFRMPRFVEDGDPLADDDRLMQGLTLTDESDEHRNQSLTKSSSDRELSRGWDRSRSATGKSKTSLVITVPPNVHLAAPSSALISGPKFVEGGILYQYSSSSSGGVRTASTFGAVGEPSTSGKQLVDDELLPSQNLLHTEDNKHAEPETLSELVEQSSVFEPVYNLYRVGETGIAAEPSTPRLMTIKEQATLRPKRRRSHGDLSERRMRIAFRAEPITPTFEGIANMDPDPEPEEEILMRRGLSLYETRGMEVPPMINLRFDPVTIKWTKGSFLFMMKGNDLGYLRYAAKYNVCSLREGANDVLQRHWMKLDPAAKLFMIWTLSDTIAVPVDPPHLKDTFFGISEMIGPVDAHQSSPFPHGELRGTIPIRWVVFKDVAFSQFDGISHRAVQVTKVRHANRIPKAAGKETFKRFFGTPHGPRASIHPEFVNSGEGLNDISRLLDYDYGQGRAIFRRTRHGRRQEDQSGAMTPLHSPRFFGGQGAQRTPSHFPRIPFGSPDHRRRSFGGPAWARQ